MMTAATDGMDESLYSDEGEGSPEKEQAESVDEQNEKDATDLMAKDSFPGGCKVGDKYEVEITGDHGDQFSVKVIDNENKKSSDMEPDEELAAMDKEY